MIIEQEESPSSAKKEVPITVDDLRTGKRARINEAQCYQITGRKRSSLQRDRWLGKGIPFQADENGRVWYAAEDVLAYLDGEKHRSTSEYDTSSQVARLAKARKAKDDYSTNRSAS
jgi:hypothetical protein